jgi:hypothetical protein
MSFKIGNVEMKGPLVLGPMAGVTDRSYRVICAEHGADLVYTEMISAKAITMKNRNTYAMIQIEESERPAALQIFGSEPDVMAEAVQIIQEKSNYDILDVNMGCPVPKVAISAQAGSALLKNPEKVGEIVNREVAKHVTAVNANDIKSVVVTNSNNASVTITDAEDIKNICTLSSCVPLNKDLVDFSKETFVYTVNFDNGTKMEVTKDGSMGYMMDVSKQTKVKFMFNTVSVLDSIFSKYAK